MCNMFKWIGFLLRISNYPSVKRNYSTRTPDDPLKRGWDDCLYKARLLTPTRATASSNAPPKGCIIVAQAAVIAPLWLALLVKRPISVSQGCTRYNG